jgi:hypothetical protein
MRISALKYLIGAVAAIVATGCSWDPLEPPGAVPAERVFLMYDNINGDSSRPFSGNVEAAGAAVAAGALGPEERVVVFQRRYYSSSEGEMRSVIYELVKDSSQSGGFRREMLKIYGAGVNDALTREVMEAVVADIRTAVPAAHYGFAFGSHGKGWIPKSSRVPISRSGLKAGEGHGHPFAELLTVPENPLTRFFNGYGQNLDVSEFVDALDGWEWDFVLLDDCFMASVEALYEMRTLADYIIASPTEIMMEGFPYGRVVETVFGDWSEEGFKNVGREFVEYYRAKTDGYDSATVAVVKMAGMDALAGAVRGLNLRIAELMPSVEGIQYYEGIINPGHVFFDLEDYLGRIRKDTYVAGYNAFVAQLGKTVLYSGHTDRFYSNYGWKQSIPVTHCCGLNVFIPYSKTTSLIADYTQTEWYKAVYAE